MGGCISNRICTRGRNTSSGNVIAMFSWRRSTHESATSLPTSRYRRTAGPPSGATPATPGREYPQRHHKRAGEATADGGTTTRTLTSLSRSTWQPFRKATYTGSLTRTCRTQQCRWDKPSCQWTLANTKPTLGDSTQVCRWSLLSYHCKIKAATLETSSQKVPHF